MATEARSRPPVGGSAPWLERPLTEALRTLRGHAILLHGPLGIGQFELALQLAAAWLCESAESGSARVGACGHCAGCRLITARSHPDLALILPETLRASLDMRRADEAVDAPSEGSAKTKPSKEIRVADMRSAVAFAQTTASRGRSKVVVFYPAERINDVAANTLLKTLEEPPGDARFILACTAVDSLLPTVRSRCQAFAVALPDPATALAWLRERDVTEPDIALAAAGGQPQEVIERRADSIDSPAWRELPRRLQKGETGAVAAWPLPRVLDALQKLCHDLMRSAAGAAPRYFPAASLMAAPALGALAAWQSDLRRAAAQIEHPHHAPLLLDALVLRAQQALGTATSPARGRADALQYTR